MSTCWYLACPGYPSDPGFLGDRQISIKYPHCSTVLDAAGSDAVNRRNRPLTCRSCNNSFQLPLVAATQEDRQKSRKDKRADTADERTARAPFRRTVLENSGGFLHSAVVPVHCDEANSCQAQQHSQDDDNQLLKTGSLEVQTAPTAFSVFSGSSPEGLLCRPVVCRSWRAGRPQRYIS